MKLVITQPGGDIQKAFRQCSMLLSAIDACLTRKGNKFMCSSKYGFLTSSPHDIGTGLEVQIKARLPKLIKVKTMYNKTWTGLNNPTSFPGFERKTSALGKGLSITVAQLVEQQSAVREVKGSSRDRTNTQGLKITEENVLSF